jgi:hypothetical protein
MPGPSTKRKLAKDVSPESAKRRKEKGKEVEREEKEDSDFEDDSDDDDEIQRYTRIRRLVEQYKTLEGSHKKFARFRLEEECRAGGLDVDTVLNM